LSGYYYVARRTDGETLGSFRSAAEAALAYARHLGSDASHAAKAQAEGHVPQKKRAIAETRPAMPAPSSAVKRPTRTPRPPVREEGCNRC
jgi:hypothetical protein